MISLVNRLSSSTWALIAILTLALLLRIVGLNWDDHSHLHPDERFLASITTDIGRSALIDREAKGCSQADTYTYFNTQCSNLNPNNIANGSFVYGTLPVFLVRGTGEVLAKLTGNDYWINYDYLHFVGRGINSVADTLTTFFIFLIGARLFSRKHGLIAAGLYAFAVLPIQLSHFYTVDILAHSFFVMGLWAAVVVAQQGRWWAYGVFGVALGCALASRVNLFPMLVLLPFAMLIYVENLRGTLPIVDGFHLPWLRRGAIAVLLTFAAFFIGFITFRVLQPYAFEGPSFTDWGDLNPKWVSDVIEVSRLSQEYSEGWPPSNQWYDRIPYLYAWWNMATWGMGSLLGLTATLSLLYILYRVLRVIQAQGEWAFPNWRRVAQLRVIDAFKPLPILTLFLLWIVAFFGYQGGISQMTMRYYLPLYAVLCLIATWGMLQLRGKAQKALVLAVLGSTLVWAFAFTNIYRHPLTRLEASEWMVDNLPAVITLEDAKGNTLPAELPSGAAEYPLMTAFKSESYLGEVFPYSPDTQTITGFYFPFSQAKEAIVNLRIFPEDNISGDPLARFTIHVEGDGQGRLALAEGEFPDLPTGNYLWHVDVTWEDEDPFRYVIPMVEWNDPEGNSHYTGLRFLSPYSTVPFFQFNEREEREAQVKVPIEASYITIPHVLGPIGDLLLKANGVEVRAIPTDIEGLGDELGPLVRYQLEHPLMIDPLRPLYIRSAQTNFGVGTVIATEGAWDDGLPWTYCYNHEYKRAWYFPLRVFTQCKPVNPYSSGYYPELGLNMAEPDNEVKHLRMMDILTKADYLVITSNRFYDALPRNECRFPFSSQYYDRLFAGDLNYTLVQQWAVFPQVAGLTFRDQVLPTSNLPNWMNELEAEEAFTVYDHPTVMLFQNRGFERHLLSPQFFCPSDANRIDLSEARSNDITRPDAPLTEGQTRQTVLIWVLGLLIAGWIGYPLVWWGLPMLPLRGFGLGRGLSWLFLTLTAWWLTSVTGINLWSRGAVVFFTALLLAANVWVAYSHWAALRDYVRGHWRQLLAMEGLFVVMLAIGLLLRAVMPDLWHPARGGEKPMDFAYLNAVLRTAQFPPPNPWLAGFEINYYYFGFVIAAFPIRLGAFPPEVGVNLVMSSLYAIVAVNVFTLAYTFLTHFSRLLSVAPRPRWVVSLALLGMGFVMLAGNLGAIKLQINPEENMHPNRWYWYPTRILGESENRAGGAINEVPLFSFVYGDLHAHIIALLPVTLYIAVCWLLATERKRYWGVPLGMIAAILYMTNSWDVLVYVPLGTVMMLLASRSIERFVKLGLVVGISGILTIAPYYLHFTLGENGMPMRWEFERSLFEPFMMVWGIPIAVVAVWLLYRLKVMLTPEADTPVEIGVAIVALGGIFAAYSHDSEQATAILCAAIAILSLALLAFDKANLRPLHASVALIFGLLLGMEYYVVRGDVGRMNTVFKTTYQLWLWLGLLMPLLLYYMWVERKLYLQTIFCLGMVALGFWYPIQSIPARYEDNETKTLTWDGMRFMQSMRLYDGRRDIVTSRDAALVRWMRANIQGFPVVAEYYEYEYFWYNRVAMFTGLPSVIGWNNHLRQQFTEQHPEIQRRSIDIRTLYTTGDGREFRDLLRLYDVRYIVVGDLELAVMTPETQAILDRLADDGELKIVFEYEDTRLYEVVNLR